MEDYHLDRTVNLWYNIRVRNYQLKGREFMNQKFTKESVREAISTKLSRYFGCTPAEATTEQISALPWQKPTKIRYTAPL